MYLDNYDGTSFLCGTSSSILTDYEFDCSDKKGYQVTVVSIATSSSVLKLCSVGILSTCDCTQSTFNEEDLKDFFPKIGELTVEYKGAAVSEPIQAGDTISYVCGSAGTGLDYCGPRDIKLVTTQDEVEIQPQFLSFDSSLNQLTLFATDKSEVGIY